MEVFLYNSNVCRLCGEENDNGTLLYSSEENNQNLSEVINTYLPIKVSDDGQLPRTICPGCTIQLEATVEFLTLIINGQKVIRELYLREKEYKKTILNPTNEQDIITEKIIYEVNTTNGVYQVEHPIALQVAGLEKPKRKRGRPPKKPKTPEELAKEAAAKEQEVKVTKREEKDDEPTGKRRRKTPTRFREAVQGKELERIFKEEGVTDGDESDLDIKPEMEIESKPLVPKEPEIIGHLEESGELVVVVKGKGRGRPKGPMRLTRKECAICGMEFTCTGRYMSHVAQHGPVLYQCGECSETFNTRLQFNSHQKETAHSGQNIIPCKKNVDRGKAKKNKKTTFEPIQIVGEQPEPEVTTVDLSETVSTVPNSLPELDPPPVVDKNEVEATVEFVEETAETGIEIASSPGDDVKIIETPEETIAVEKTEETDEKDTTATGKVRLKCNHCEKTFSNKQSKSMHIKAVHLGERAYACGECGASFAYPRSLALHAVWHRRRNAPGKGYACDLCGKVLNHPSSVVYHKEAEHAGQRYVCNKCGKSFKHKQLLQRHQLVHSQDRPYSCKSCNASFKTKANLLNHSLLHSGVKKFSCEICKHKFAHKTSLTLHMRWHTGQKPYACSTCGKCFSQKGNLSEHERIHTGEKPFQCAQCPRRFTTSSQHRLHLRRHAAARPHACAHCGKRFASRAAAAAHLRREAGPRAHRCDHCGRAFAERWPLLKHLRLHSGERPFRCPHCPRAFADCSNLNKHKKQVHKQISLLANSNPQLAPAAVPAVVPTVPLPAAEITLVPKTSPALLTEEVQDDELEERVIYVTYDVDDTDSPAFHILDPEQAAGLEESKVLSSCELYGGASLLVPEPEYAQLALGDAAPLQQDLALAPHQHMPVTDEQGNPLHFTMQDGTRLAITSADGKSLQVITQDGQTIPVEINGYANEEEVDNPDTIVHQLNLQKTVDSNVSSPVTHYFTIV
ncbi:zinc finger protein 135-like [Trichoplusia ni]|uniref:Zinc finger protein 135-like n=1 Tax=Trichoplusia ni TaxID=7111 RepID=A0A7E5VEQ3_TRINI|nr:zinc finger protein 135-like [Trichoplusia ni]